MEKIELYCSIGRSRDNEKRIVEFDIRLPGEVAAAIDTELAKPFPHKVSWLKRKWRVLKVHIKYLLGTQKEKNVD